MKQIFVILLLITSLAAGDLAAQKAGLKNKTLIFFFDGLRPDYITVEQMPNLHAFRQAAAFGSKHHSVFPTVTRVNSASYATGSYPGTHGILGNAIYIPEVEPGKSIGTSHGDLSRIAATGQPILTAVSLGELLEKAGEKMMVFSSGTSGQAFLQNHKISGGAIVNPGLILPESFKAQVMADLGEVPKEGNEDLNRHKWVTDALIRYSLSAEAPLVSAIWLSDPDGAAHEHGMGSPEAVESIKFVDAQFGRVIETLKTRGLTNEYNIIISTDHGFVTHIGSSGISEFLVAEGLKQSKDSDDVILAEGSIYVKGHDPEKIKSIVAALQEEEIAGAIFTKAKTPGDKLGWVEGTLSFDLIHFNHQKRTPDILVAPDWNDVKNKEGIAGTSYATGVAGHGGSSRYEIQIALFAKGPDFKNGFTSELPTSNVDIAPTVLSLYNLPIPAEMNGRPAFELIKNAKGKKPTKPEREVTTTEVQYPWGKYIITLIAHTLDEYRYIDYVKAERIFTK